MQTLIDTSIIATGHFPRTPLGGKGEVKGQHARQGRNTKTFDFSEKIQTNKGRD